MNYFFDKWSPGIILGGHQEKTASHHMLQVTSAEGAGYTLVLNAFSKATCLLMFGLFPCQVTLELCQKVAQVLHLFNAVLCIPSTSKPRFRLISFRTIGYTRKVIRLSIHNEIVYRRR